MQLVSHRRSQLQLLPAADYLYSRKALTCWNQYGCACLSGLKRRHKEWVLPFLRNRPNCNSLRLGVFPTVSSSATKDVVMLTSGNMVILEAWLNIATETPTAASSTAPIDFRKPS